MRRGVERKRSLVAGLFAAALLWASGCTTVEMDPDSSTGPRHPEVDRVFEDLDRSDGPGAVVAVLQGGEVVHKSGYGMANLDHAIPITTRTVFDIASISKQFGAMAALLLESDGRLDLDADVRTYVPEMPDFGYTITPRHLIHHTSGIRDWPHAMMLGGVTYNDVISFDQILRMLYRQEELNFPPGEEYSYSNTGYNLLARIVEVQSGQTFREFTTDRIFRPLGMNDTHFSDDYLEVVPGRAESYAPADDGYERRVNQLTALASSSLHTTLDDFVLWVRNFETGQVGEELVERMLDRGTLNDGQEIAYAHGLSYGNYRGLEQIGHSGSWAGYRTQFQRFPEHDLDIVVFCNVSDCDPARRLREVAMVFLADVFGPASSAAGGGGPDGSPPQLSGAELGAYEGSYRSEEFDSTYDLVVEDGVLLARHWRNDSAVLTPLEDDVFEGDRPWLPRLEFRRDAQGRIDSFLASGSRVRNVVFERR